MPDPSVVLCLQREFCQNCGRSAQPHLHVQPDVHAYDTFDARITERHADVWLTICPSCFSTHESAGRWAA